MDTGVAEDQGFLFAPIPVEKFDSLTREELVILLKGEQDLRRQMESEVHRLRALNEELKQKSFLLGETYLTVKNKLFGQSSEREARSGGARKPRSTSPKKKKIQLPSERYRQAPLIERHVELQELPVCRGCGEAMKDSGMTEDNEFLTV